jgi:hypothetical protein
MRSRFENAQNVGARERDRRGCANLKIKSPFKRRDLRNGVISRITRTENSFS